MTKRALLAKIERGEPLFDREAVRAQALGLGEIYRTATGQIALQPYGYRTPPGKEKKLKPHRYSS